jgi:hypothetical protein
LRAGARNVISPIWPVTDAGARRFSTRLLSAYHADGDIARAFALAARTHTIALPDRAAWRWSMR